MKPQELSDELLSSFDDPIFFRSAVEKIVRETQLPRSEAEQKIHEMRIMFNPDQRFLMQYMNKYAYINRESDHLSIDENDIAALYGCNIITDDGMEIRMTPLGYKVLAHARDCFGFSVFPEKKVNLV